VGRAATISLAFENIQHQLREKSLSQKKKATLPALGSREEEGDYPSKTTKRGKPVSSLISFENGTRDGKACAWLSEEKKE